MVATDVNETNWINSATVVPEPGTLSLLSLGLIGLAWEARRARTSRARSLAQTQPRQYGHEGGDAFAPRRSG